jgi:asparagine synthase (glutamine-hydrolysing)
MGRLGAEVSPLHLHALPEVAKIKGIDAVIAGSYGDSVGRAEFSGRRLTALRSILPKTFDQFGILRDAIRRDALTALRKDTSDSPHLNGNLDTLRQREIEQELHYMRRMLQSSMLVIAQEIPLYQIFTSPKVFGLMWNLDPAMRNNSWYKYLLSGLPGNLLNIPWSRTGKRYGKTSGPSDKYSKEHHSYGIWLRRDLREQIENRVNSNRIRELAIFNNHGLDNALRVWRKATTKTTNSLDELMTWIASFHDFLEAYDLSSLSAPKNKTTLKETIRCYRGRIHAELYTAARNFIRE